MQRLVGECGEFAVRGHGHEDLGGLEADLVIVEIVFIENVDVTQRRFDQRVGCRLAIFLLQIFFQRSGVDADAQWYAVGARRVDHRAHAVFTADVAGIDAQTGDAEFGDAQRDLVVEVDVGDQRHGDLLADLTEGLSGR